MWGTLGIEVVKVDPETVELRVQRGKEMIAVKARIGEVEAAKAAGGKSIPGLAGAALADAQRGKERAVLVSAVEAGSAAFTAGLRPGDLIVGVNRRRVASVQELAKLLSGSGRLALNVMRGDFQLTIVLR